MLEKALLLVAWVSAAISSSLFVYFSNAFFFGDDLPLIADALRGTSLLEPISSHVRPAVRAHFRLYELFPSAHALHWISVVLHGVASWLVFVLLRRSVPNIRAAIGGLLFYSIFVANEAVYWIAAVGVIYCFIFSVSSLLAADRGWYGAASLALMMASLSYELWVVPAFLIVARSPRLPAALVVGAVAAVQLAILPTGSAASYGGFELAAYPIRFSIYLYRSLSPLSGQLTAPLAILLMVATITLALARQLRPAVAWYSISATVLSFSAVVAPRFYYFPAMGIVLTLAYGLDTRARFACGTITLYLLCISPFVNHLDGLDHRQWASTTEFVYRSIVTSESRIVPDPAIASELRRTSVGRQRPIFIRDGSVGGLVYATDALEIARRKPPLPPLWGRRRISPPD